MKGPIAQIICTMDAHKQVSISFKNENMYLEISKPDSARIQHPRGLQRPALPCRSPLAIMRESWV